MSGGANNEKNANQGDLDHRDGCPVCEHSDPELERELRVFAELLLDIHFAKQEEQRQSLTRPEIDNIS